MLLILSSALCPSGAAMVGQPQNPCWQLMLGAVPGGVWALENKVLQQVTQQVLYFLRPKLRLQFCQSIAFLMVMVLYKISLHPLIGAADYLLLKVVLCLSWHVVQTLLLLWVSQPFFSEDSLFWHGFVQAISL